VKNKPEKPAGAIDWSLCTYAGAEREQLRRWSKLPLRAKLAAVEEMGDLAERFLTERRARGLPYFDPQTGELVRGG
jgi:hypothetical protein